MGDMTDLNIGEARIIDIGDAPSKTVYQFCSSDKDGVKLVGTLCVEHGKLVFEGDAEPAAAVLFDTLKVLCDEYVEKEREDQPYVPDLGWTKE